jgi:hypothetical protein
MRENTYQAHVIEKVQSIFPDCIILKNDPTYIQGFPDLLILVDWRWAALEVKADPYASFQPNQEYYVRLLDKMSFAEVITPVNEEEVLNALQRALRI